VFDPGTEFDRQVRNLLDRDYPSLSGLSEGRFVELVTPLREVAIERAATPPAPPATEPPAPRPPFLLVISTDVVPAGAAMTRTALGDRAGFADFTPDDLARFRPVDGLDVPAGRAYLVLDVDRGVEFRAVPPEKALLTIAERGRTPLTVAEGIALITHHPGALEKNRCFSLAGSRAGDRRVPALWISKRAPKLGWCWAGNPHTWLGCASARARAAPVSPRSGAGTASG
jgi:hypothetical protein